MTPQGSRSNQAIVQQAEYATPEADRQIKEALDAIGQKLNSARRMMDM